MTETADLPDWIESQAQRSAAAMERAISASQLTRQREVFGQTVRPAAGSVLASPVMASWDPEPDYFFHWVRDSAIVMRAVAELMHDAPAPVERARWRGHFEDYVRFSLKLSEIDGAQFLRQNRYRDTTRRGFRKHLRPEAQLRALRGDKLLGEPRFSPDGTPDILRWSRPQYDGPALRALACLRYLELGGPPSAELARLLRQDLDFTLRHADRRCIGPWEEPRENFHHYYVGLAQLGALVHGRAWAGAESRRWQAAEAKLRAGLDRHWSAKHQVYRAIREAEGTSADALIDAAVLVAVLDADLPDGPHSAFDERMQATLTALERLFAGLFPINRERPPGRGPALGRSRDDRYFGGGAWYPTTLAAAGLCYRIAAQPGGDRAAWLARGDAFMATVRNLTPADGALSEQVDRTTGRQTSARHLTWSYAAFVSTARLRRLALG